MDNPIVVKARAMREASEKFSCTHESTELRNRTVAGGHIQRVYQCLRCGAATSRALSREQALLATGGKEPAPFNDSLLDDWTTAKRDAFAEINADFSQFGHSGKSSETKTADWWRHYNSYLLTPEWQDKKRKVILRAQGICEGCRDAPATTAHHTTYAHVGEEFLFELLALCEPCHRRLHGESPGAR